MIAAVSLLALGFAMTAQAGPRLYEGTLIIHAFANDTTDGTTTPFTTNEVVAHPLDAQCHQAPFHAKETFTFITYYGNAQRTETVPSYGGQIAYHHTNSETTPAGCGAATLAMGNPMTGKGTIHTTGSNSTPRPYTNPRGFTVVASEFYGTGIGGSFAYVFPYIFTKVYTNLRNERGVFCENCGPGRYSSSPSFTFNTGGGEASIRVTPGIHKFGGTMRLLGTLYSIGGFASVYDTYVAKYTWLFDYFGAAGAANGSSVFAVAFGQDYNYYWGRNGFASDTTTVQAKGLSWTTGIASVTGIGGPFTTVEVRAGFDNRTSHGRGDIQMVSPMLTRWIFASNSYYTAGIGIMRIRVAPEPHEWMLLGAGISMLGLLYRANRRSR